MIPIVKPYLPPMEKYQEYVESIYERNWLTNNGPLVRELEARLEHYLGVNNLMVVANGTIALQVAYRALGLNVGEVITTPFTFAASPGSLMWQNLQPKFVDIDAKTLNLDPNLIASQLTPETKAILPVHVFGNPCEVEKITDVATKHNLKVIYDAAHTFGSKYKDKALLSYGDAATISFHATKLFHCVEGGAIVFRERSDLDKAKKLINFGFDINNYPVEVGINGKMSEFHAAMGLSVLDDIGQILARRQEIVSSYQKHLRDVVEFQHWSSHSSVNGAYAPVLFENEKVLLKVEHELKINHIQSRRYFYPSMGGCMVYNDMPKVPVSESVSKRVLCLPLFYDLSSGDIQHICNIITQTIKSGC